MARLGDQLLAGVLILAGCAVASAQNPLPQTATPVNRDSHILLPGSGIDDRRWAEQQLQARLRQARDLREAMEVLEQLLKNDELKKLDPETIKRLGARMQGKDGERRIDPNDPEVKKLIGQLRDRLAGQGKDLKPEQLEKLKKVIGDLPGNQQAQNPNDPRKPRDPKDPMGMGEPREPPRPPVDPMPPRPPEQANPLPPNATPPAEEPKKEEESPRPARRNRTWLGEQLESLKSAAGLDKPMNRLFGPEGMFRNLTGDLSSRTRSLSSQLLPRNLRLDRLFSGSGEGSGSSGGLTSSLPNISLTPNFSSGEGSGSGTGGMLSGALVMVVLAGGGGLILWLIFLGGKRLTQGGDNEWKPGPWPVAPAGIRTAADLIRAFEHLALVVVGYRARSRHHRALAELIGGAEPTDRRFAAEDLAQLYEVARYAPPQDELTETDVERARRDLMLLTGEPTA